MEFDRVNPKVNILAVDDHWENLLALEALLTPLGQNLVKASSGEEALRCLLQEEFAVILLDVHMPRMDGFETASLIRERDRTRSTPIIFLTAFSKNDNFMFRGYSLGAVDYLIKPIEPEILLSKVTVFVELFQKTTELKTSEERFRSLSACSPVGIFVIDTAGHCTYMNPRCQTILGSTNAESFPEGWLQLVHPDDRERVSRRWLAWIQKNQDYSQEFRLQSYSEEPRWVHVRVAPMLSSQNNLLGHVGTVEEITERKQAEEARAEFIREQAARQQAEEANRLKDEFLATLSHELRTPLNSILGWSKLLRSQKFSEEKTLKALETIERNARLQAKLIEDILDISRIIWGKLHLNCLPVNLVSVIEIAIEDLRLTFEDKEIELTFNLAQIETPEEMNAHQESSASPTQYLVSGDSSRLQQIVWNLLSNAIKFTPQRGQIQVDLSIETKPTCNCETRDNNHHSKTTQFARLKIRDTGIGIAPEFIPYVFDRFRQADGTTTRFYGGLGLGLAIVRHLVEMQGGTVSVESEGENQGATFTIMFPMVETPGELETDNSPDPIELKTWNTTSLRGLRLLVVDDDADTRELLMQILIEQGAEVKVVDSVRAALKALQQSLPDLLISDIGMPEEDGYSLIQKVRNFEFTQGKRIPAIAVTAYTRDQDFHQAITEGFDLYIPKPILPNELMCGITKLVEETRTDFLIKKNNISVPS